MKIRSFAILYFLYVSMSCLLMAQSADYGIAVTEMPMLDRMPSRSVLCMMQDSDGEMWFGTEDGLCRDNGYSVRVYRPTNPHTGISNNRITSVAQATDGAVWFGTTRGLYRVDKRTQAVIPVADVKSDNAEIKGVYATSDGSVWVSVYGTLLRFRDDGTRVKDYQIQWQNMPSSVYSLYEDRQGRIWVTIRNGGICRYDNVSDSWVYYPWPYREGSGCILQDRSAGYFYVSVWLNGITRFNPDAATADDMFVSLLSRGADSERETAYLHMTQDDVKGYLWVTTISGLQVYSTDQASLHPVDVKNFTVNRSQMLTDICKDRNGNLWVGGLNVPSFVVSISSNIVTHSLAAVHTSGDQLTTISGLCYDDTPGALWLFQDRHKLYLYDVTSDKVLDMRPDLFEDAHMNIGATYVMTKAHRSSGIWVADTYSHEILRLSNVNNHISVDERIHIAGALPKVLREDQSGRLWVGTGNGLYTYNIGTHELKAVDDIGTVSDVAATPDGCMVVAAYDSTGESYIYRYINGVRSSSYRFGEDCTALAVTRDNSLWVGTRLGKVWRLVSGRDAERLAAISDYEPRGYVRGFDVDSCGHLWIQTEQRLTELEPATLDIRHYYVGEEYISLFNFQPRSYVVLPSGAFVVGGSGGVCRLTSTQSLSEVVTDDKPVVTYIRIDGEDVDLPASDGVLNVASGSHSIEIEFGTPDHLGAKRKVHVYRLDGRGEWVVIPTGSNQIHLTGIGNGKHLLELRSVEADSTDVGQIMTLTINHQAAFYETWWFIAIVLLLCGGMIVFAIRRKNDVTEISTIDEDADVQPDADSSDTVGKIDNNDANIEDVHDEEPDTGLADEGVEAIDYETNADATNVSSTHDEDLLQRIMVCVEKNITNTDYGIAELSRDVNMSRMNLYRKIHTITGQTPTDFVKSVRLKKAADMLRENKYSIVEVAYAVGYSSPSYFTRSFKSEFGLTPTQYIGHAHHGKME